MKAFKINSAMTKASLSQDAFNELSYYTLAHPDKIYFIHQHIVDAWQAQTADPYTKPIGLIFSLAGLYLCVEKKYSGRQVQLVHMKMAQNKKEWPKIDLPDHRGSITVTDVLKTAPGDKRDLMIRDWCDSVWKAYRNCHETIAALVKKESGII